MSSSKRQIVLIIGILLLINVVLCFYALYLNRIVSIMKVQQNQYRDHINLIENEYLQNVIFYRDSGDIDFDLFIEMARNICSNDYYGIIIPENPCSVCTSELYETLSKRSLSDTAKCYVLFAPKSRVKDCRARLNGMDHIHIIGYDEYDYQYGVEQDAMLVYYYDDAIISKCFRINKLIKGVFDIVL